MEEPKSILQDPASNAALPVDNSRKPRLEVATLFAEPVAVVEASLGLSFGLLALTDSEIVYATSRASRKPKVVRWNRDAIEDVTYQLHQTSGTLAFSAGGTRSDSERLVRLTNSKHSRSSSVRPRYGSTPDAKTSLSVIPEHWRSPRLASVRGWPEEQREGHGDSPRWNSSCLAVRVGGIPRSPEADGRVWRIRWSVV